MTRKRGCKKVRRIRFKKSNKILFKNKKSFVIAEVESHMVKISPDSSCFRSSLVWHIDSSTLTSNDKPVFSVKFLVKAFKAISTSRWEQVDGTQAPKVMLENRPKTCAGYKNKIQCRGFIDETSAKNSRRPTSTSWDRKIESTSSID